MATTTPNFGWDIPQSTDLVKDGATAIAALGTDIDTALVDLKGGTTGQVLSKNSNTDLDFTWVAQDDSNAIQNALLTTTGDTIYASGASTPARLGIGTAGQVLTVNSGATAPEWKTISSSAPSWRTSVAGRYVTMSQGSPKSSNSLGWTEDQTIYTPIYLNGYTFDRISTRTGSTFSGTAAVRLGIYNASATTVLPTTVYLDAGTVSCTAASTTYEITISTTPPAGWYWLAWNLQTLATTNSFAAITSTTNYDRLINGTGATIETTTAQSGFNEGGITGAFATAGPLGVFTSDLPLIGLRIA
jgi:hypothetical protein